MRVYLYRMLGNELPPRDLPGSRVTSLQHILMNEPPLTYVSKRWLLNSVVDPHLLGLYKHSLEHEVTTTRKIDPRAYDRSLKREDRIRYAININAARNQCLEEGFRDSDSPPEKTWVFVLDGDCFFAGLDWSVLLNQLLRNQASPHAVRHVSVPTYRVHSGFPYAYLDRSPTEPMLGFRGDSEFRFDESIPFGSNDKQELLYRLGHCQVPGCSHVLLSAAEDCIQLSHCRHFATGALDVERSTALRCQKRAESLDGLLRMIDAPSAAETL